MGMARTRHIGFISTRFSGADGVSLETAKWAEVLHGMGYKCFYFCGECDRPPEVSFVVPEAFYRHPVIEAINSTVFTAEWGQLDKDPLNRPQIADLYKDFFSIYIRPARITRQIQELKESFKEELYTFTKKFQIEVLITENALTIPVNIPLGLAITEFIAETGFPTIAHHHDFYWERQRFLNNSVHDYLAMAFPPNLPSVRHVVINSVQAHQLASRTGISSMVVPNVMDFDTPPAPLDEYVSTARADLGLKPGEYMILQPTRIIQRKGIEHSIELVRRLELPAHLVVSHAAGDEGTEYEQRVHEFAALLDVPVHFESDIVGDRRGITSGGRKIYALGDIYPQADLVTYPSSVEGFGNAFLEAIYYKRPLVVNKYSIYETDIKPKGFKVIEFDGFISDDTVAQARRALLHPEEKIESGKINYDLARRYYSYSMLEHRLSLLMADCLGEAV